MRLLVLALLVFASSLYGTAAAAQSTNDWADCVVSKAPVSALNWVELGGPKSKLGEDAQRRARNLSYRLKAICAQHLAPGEKISDLEFNANSVFKRVRKHNDKTPISSNAIEASFDSAGFCSTYLFFQDLGEIGDDPRAIDQSVLDSAPMSFSGYDLINPEVPNPFLVDTNQSNGNPGKMFNSCQVIQSDGSLADA